MYKCKKCEVSLEIKSAQFTDFLQCPNCKQKTSEKDLIKGIRTESEFKQFKISDYIQNINSKKFILLFAGAYTSSKKHISKSRVFLNADIYDFNIISISHKNGYFNNIKIELENYAELIKFICEKYKIFPRNLDIIGFSNGGIPVLELGKYLRFNTLNVISPVILENNIYNSIVNNKLNWFINTNDKMFTAEAYERFLNQFNSKNIVIIKVPSGHVSRTAIKYFF